MRPFAMVLSCADARVPPEIVFNTGLGDLFVVRSLGGVADRAVIGSLEHGAAHLHVPLLVVMGHESCDVVREATGPGDGTGPNQQYLWKAIRAGITRPAGEQQELRAAILANVEQAINDVLAGSELLRQAVSAGRLQVVGRVLRTGTGRGDLLRAGHRDRDGGARTMTRAAFAALPLVFALATGIAAAQSHAAAPAHPPAKVVPAAAPVTPGAEKPVEKAGQKPVEPKAAAAASAHAAVSPAARPTAPAATSAPAKAAPPAAAHATQPAAPSATAHSAPSAVTSARRPHPHPRTRSGPDPPAGEALRSPWPHQRGAVGQRGRRAPSPGRVAAGVAAGDALRAALAAAALAGAVGAAARALDPRLAAVAPDTIRDTSGQIGQPGGGDLTVTAAECAGFCGCRRLRAPGKKFATALGRCAPLPHDCSPSHSSWPPG